MSMVANRRDIAFYLNELFDLPSLLATPLFNEHDVESIEAIFDVVQQIAEEVFLPCAAELDEHEPRFDNGQALTPDSLKDCVRAYREAGLCGATFGHDVGGLQLPCVVTNLMQGILMAANAPALGYMTLTAGNAHMLQACGDDALKQRYLAPMVEGRWFGTMCLSEPQAGSSLSDIRTLATPVGDGSYQLSGTKMWISGGDHDLTDNIVHMVLARTPDAPAGTRGISLFLVPKHRVNEDGSLGDFNHVVLAGLNHKMGQRGTTNTLLNFGESGECIGYLVGEEHQGLRNMFHMMNEARIGVGMLATMSGLAGYLYSLDYARNRPQGRHPGDKDPTTPMLPIIEHADIKRLLLEQKAAVEGSIALLSYCSSLVDRQLTAADQETRQRLTVLLELMTPVAKSWPSEFALEANKHAIQVLGGYGYTREYPVERLYRDNRLNPIHEGTHAIHGMDLLGRKVTMANGMALTLLAEEILPTINAARAARELVPYAQALEEAWQAILEAVDSNKTCPDAVLRLANATPFLDAFGHVVIAWLWLWQAQVAQEKVVDASGADQDFYRGKIQTCAFFYRYQLPKVYHWLSLARDLDATCVDMSPSQF